MVPSPQIPLNLDPRRPDRIEDFVPGPNAAVLDVLHELLEERGQSLFLYGPAGSGKSHLLNGLCQQARERGMAAFSLAMKHLSGDAQAGVSGLGAMDLVCIDDIDAVAGDPAWEESLFHCFNQVQKGGGRLLISSAQPLSALPFSLPDLQSRLAWGIRQSLQLPGDDDRRAILAQRAQTLGIELPDEVINWLLRYARRDTKSLVNALEEIRKEAFAAKRKITVPLARSVLGGASEEHGRRETC